MRATRFYSTYIKYLVVVMFTAINYMAIFIFFRESPGTLGILSAVFIITVPAIASALEIKAKD